MRLTRLAAAACLLAERGDLAAGPVLAALAGLVPLEVGLKRQALK
jgi:hypothetical protein